MDRNTKDKAVMVLIVMSLLTMYPSFVFNMALQKEGIFAAMGLFNTIFISLFILVSIMWIFIKFYNLIEEERKLNKRVKELVD